MRFRPTLCGLIPLILTFSVLPIASLQAADEEKLSDKKEEKVKGKKQPEEQDESTEKKLEDVPLRLTTVADEKKHRWDPLNNGSLIKGSGCFNGAMEITNGSKEFEVGEVWEDMGKDTHRTYRIEGELSGVDMDRRLRVDRELGAARYLDVFSNTGDDDLTMVFSYKIEMSFEPAAVYSSRGRQLGSKLGSRDFGIAIEAPEGEGCPGALLVVAHERSENKPTITMRENGKVINLDYRLTIKAGQKVALVHWLAQQEFQGGENLEEEFAPLYADRKLVAPPVGKNYLELVANFPANYDDMVGGSDYLVAVTQLTDQLQLERLSDNDRLRLDNGSVLNGKALGGDLVVSSRFGEVNVPIADVAVLRGSAGRGREPKVYLRDGSVYSGPVKTEGLGLDGGFEMTQQMEQLDYLFYRLGDSDGAFPEGTELFVQFHTGEVLPVSGAGDLEIGVISPWGRVGFRAGEISWMRYVEEPSPRYRIALMDGSLLTVFLDPAELKLNSGRLEEVTFGAAELSALWGAEVELPKGFDTEAGIEEIEEIPKSMAGDACLLSGSNLIAGSIANEEFRLLTGATTTSVKVADVLRMSRTGDGSELSPVFEIELAGGDKVTGMLQDRVIEVRSGSGSWQVPVQHFIAMRTAAAPTESDDAEADEVEDKDKQSSTSPRRRRMPVKN